jgi:hypothetical protein
MLQTGRSRAQSNYICTSRRPSLWSSGQSSWLQIQRSFDSRRYQIFWEIVGLERGPLSFMSTTEELLWRNSSGSGLENLDYGRRDPPRWPRDTLCPRKVALTSSTNGGLSAGIVRPRSQAMELLLFICMCFTNNASFLQPLPLKHSNNEYDYPSLSYCRARQLSCYSTWVIMIRTISRFIQPLAGSINNLRFSGWTCGEFSKVKPVWLDSPVPGAATW